MQISAHDAHVRPALAPRRVLVATSLGDPASCALKVAMARAAGWGAELAICHVGDVERRELSERSLDAMGEAAIDCTLFPEHGDIAEAVARRASSWAADLLIVGGAKGGEGRISRSWNSRVGWDIVRRSPCPVLITRHTPATGRMVVGTDLGTGSAAAVRAAALEQARTGAQATLVHGVRLRWRPTGVALERADRDDIMRRMEDAARVAGLRGQHRIVIGPVGVGLVTVATELAADLVVVGAGSRTRGGVAARVARDAPCAVLIVV